MVLAAGQIDGLRSLVRRDGNPSRILASPFPRFSHFSHPHTCRLIAASLWLVEESHVLSLQLQIPSTVPLCHCQLSFLFNYDTRETMALKAMINWASRKERVCYFSCVKSKSTLYIRCASRRVQYEEKYNKMDGTGWHYDYAEKFMKVYFSINYFDFFDRRELLRSYFHKLSQVFLFCHYYF